VVTELLQETNSGVDAPTIPDIKNTIKELHQEYKLKGEITYNGWEPEINKYSHLEMASKFAEVLDSVARRAE